MFSLLAFGSSSSILVAVRFRFGFGVESGVNTPVDLFEMMEEDRERDERFPSTVVAV